jgi:2,2-dialkylglycine decarboxylase (pyruvate)
VKEIRRFLCRILRLYCTSGASKIGGMSDQLIRYAGAFSPGIASSASGSFYVLDDGRRMLDFTAGQICATIGHNHPRVVEAIERACRDVLHLNSWVLSEPVVRLARQLVATLPPPLERAMFLSTGGEANEAALRMAKLFSGGFEVLALTRSWHGVTAGASAITHAGARRGYGPATPGVFALAAPYAYRCPIRHCESECDCSCLEAGFELYDQATVGAPAAVVAEPVLSAGGVIVPPPGYFLRLAELCAERDLLLILDECQTGLGRLGSLYGFEIYDVLPDFLTLSKTLGGGVPVSALVTRPDVEQHCFERGFMHATSHVSDPLGAAAAEAVLDVVIEQDLAGAARERGDRLMGGLRELQERHEAIGDVRGMGLLCGVELVDDRETRARADSLGHAVTDECLRCGLSINLVRGQTAGPANCLRIAPPLTISDDEIDLGLSILDEALATVTARAGVA